MKRIILGAIVLAAVVPVRSAEPARDDQAMQLPIQAALAEAMAARLAVSEYQFANGVWPADLAATRYRPWVSGAIKKDGVIALTLQGATHLAGKSLEFAPTLTADGGIEWTCFSRDIPQEDLPADCRRVAQEE
jgi:hypothetical protein